MRIRGRASQLVRPRIMCLHGDSRAICDLGCRVWNLCVKEIGGYQCRQVVAAGGVRQLWVV